MQDPNNKTEKLKMTVSANSNREAISANRRRLLQMGAAGLPMVLTLRASASEAVVSQLRCLFVLPDNIKILVDDEGRAWVGNGDIQTGNNGYKTSDIEAFKSNADYVFPAGSVPETYRPDACQDSGGDRCDDDDGWGGGHHWASATSDEHGYTASDNIGRSSGWGSGGHGWGDDDCHGDDHWSSKSGGGYHGGWGGHGWGDDDDGGSGGSGAWTDCGYNLYDYGTNYSIKPGDFLNNGSWNMSGDSGLFLTLSILYADEYGNTGSWPGVSCIVSVLNYLGQ